MKLVLKIVFVNFVESMGNLRHNWYMRTKDWWITGTHTLKELKPNSALNQTNRFHEVALGKIPQRKNTSKGALRELMEWEDRYPKNYLWDRLKKTNEKMEGKPIVIPHNIGFRPGIVILDDLEDNSKKENTMYNEEVPTANDSHHEVKIKRVTNGFIVKVGCMTLVSKSWKEISSELEKYWKDPNSMQVKYEKIKNENA